MSDEPCFDPKCKVCHEDSQRGGRVYVMGRPYRIKEESGDPLSWPDDFVLLADSKKPLRKPHDAS